MPPDEVRVFETKVSARAYANAKLQDGVGSVRIYVLDHMLLAGAVGTKALSLDEFTPIEIIGSG